MGSKRKIADKLIEVMPRAECFYDLFAGGCAMTHAALLSHKWDRVICNDINDVPKLFCDAVNGKIKDETRWISRDDFFSLKDTDPYVRICWSFGNDGRTYLYGREIEPYKKALHYAVFFNDFADLHRLCPEVANECEEGLKGIVDKNVRRVKIGRVIVKQLKAMENENLIESNPLCRSCHKKKGRYHNAKLQRLERLQRLESLERLERLETDYRNVSIAPNSVIYCDPPYRGTQKYEGYNAFDYEAFYDWALKQNNIFISEYSMPPEFECILAIPHRSTLCATANNAVLEKLFVPKEQAENHKENLLQLIYD